MNPATIYRKDVVIPADKMQLAGDLIVPEDARGIVVFAHGSGSGRLSPRNQFVAGVLSEHQFATLLFDLLSMQEEAIDQYTAEYRFDIELLANRLALVTDWVETHPRIANLKLGYFGASTGAAAALIAATRREHRVKAVVSRGGRPDLAGPVLHAVKAPTLLIVGSRDTEVIRLNEAALAALQCTKELVLVPGATHLFEERGALENVATLASDWFVRNLAS